MSIIVANCQQCDEQQFQTQSCVQLHDFLSSKVRFIHLSTITGSHSCFGKNYAYILLLMKTDKHPGCWPVKHTKAKYRNANMDYILRAICMMDHIPTHY